MLPFCDAFSYTSPLMPSFALGLYFFWADYCASWKHSTGSYPTDPIWQWSHSDERWMLLLSIHLTLGCNASWSDTALTSAVSSLPVWGKDREAQEPYSTCSSLGLTLICTCRLSAPAARCHHSITLCVFTCKTLCVPAARAGGRSEGLERKPHRPLADLIFAGTYCKRSIISQDSPSFSS